MDNKKLKWPTLKGRLSQPITSTGEALQQMKANGDELTEHGQKLLNRYERRLRKMWGEVLRRHY